MLAALSKPLYARNAASRVTKLAVLRTVMLTQLTFGAETWTLTEAEWQKIHVFEMQGMRKVLGLRATKIDDQIRYPRNADVWKEIQKLQPAMGPIRGAVERRQVVFWGKMLRMGKD